MKPPEEVDGVILAAGSSSRFSAFKPAALIRGKPMLHHCIDGMREVCSRIVVVGGSGIDQVRTLLKEYAIAIDLVENHRWAGGMFTSVKAGLARVGADAALVLPVDCPLVPVDVCRILLETKGLAVVPTYGKRRGHPLLIRRGVFASVLEEPDGSSLREVLRRSGVVEVEVDAGEVLLDLDTPEDIERIHTASTCWRGPAPPARSLS